MRNGVLERVDNVKRGRGRPKLTWDELVKRDLKDWTEVELSLDFRVLNSQYEPSLVLFCMLNRKDIKHVSTI